MRFAYQGYVDPPSRLHPEKVGFPCKATRVRFAYPGYIDSQSRLHPEKVGFPRKATRVRFAYPGYVGYVDVVENLDRCRFVQHRYTLAFNPVASVDLGRKLPGEEPMKRLNARLNAASDA